MDIAAFTALSGALTSLKTIIDIAKSVNNQQLNAAVLDVQGRLIDVKQLSLALQHENQSLRDELQSLRDTSDTAAKMRFDGESIGNKMTRGFRSVRLVGTSIRALCGFSCRTRMAVHTGGSKSLSTDA